MKLRFMKKNDEGNDVWSFYFKPLEPLTWIAGQSVRLELPRKMFGIDERRFTITSAPFESHVMITTKLSDSSFKQNLRNLKPDEIINGYAVEGKFVWDKDMRHRLLIAGGIGITPYRSMIAQKIYEKQPLDATLIYSSKAKPAVFEKELLQWQRQDLSFHCHFLISKRLIFNDYATLVPAWLQSKVYISGPSKMVEELSSYLLEFGLSESYLKQDLFTGNLD
ncbi:FAD-dependent oxidoreductase [Candidatus Saccharibacteria bacterium]|nr:FAD-dependent oxidoreductase [Candidatus Saccharibacteria bacterium]